MRLTTARRVLTEVKLTLMPIPMVIIVVALGVYLCRHGWEALGKLEERLGNNDTNDTEDLRPQKIAGVAAHGCVQRFAGRRE